MKAIDWTKMYKKYAGQWVAMADDEITVIASGPTARQAWDKARKRGYVLPILNRIPTEVITFAGGNYVL